jgi:hypothetical protein
MQIGQVVDFTIAYNERHKTAASQSEEHTTTRKATQEDIDAFFG